MTDIKPHPAAELFPLMDDDTFRGLKADIGANGQIEPIVVHEGQILDGRNRYRACRELGIEPRTMNWTGTGSPSRYVISKNLHRRHLTESQRGLIAARLAPQSRENSLKNLKGYQPHSSDAEISASDALTVNEAADALCVSRDTVANAKTVLREASPEEIKAVEDGSMTVGGLSRKIKQKNRQENCSPRSKGTASEKRLRQKIWTDMKEAMRLLGNMPSPEDVAAIASEKDRGKSLNASLPIATEWLKEFQDAWERRKNGE